MIIQSIRLKNIKCYGNGANDAGVTIAFEPGANRVAGRNGHGKTTLIECIGYALFLTPPQSEEYFQIETYFLSYGAKEGEIDVTFSCEGDSYRIERAVGKQTKRRSKVIQLSDQSICAEGDQEVAAFLCRLLRFPDPGHLTEVFCKLVGVKQGRLTWPFDSKPGEARRYFEPLLDVEVFRDCFDRLKGTVETFESQRREHLTKLAAINERINERANSPEMLVGAQQRVAATTTALTESATERDAALSLKEHLEILGKAVESSRNVLNSANQTAAHAKTLWEVGEKQLSEAKDAVQVLADNETANKAHTEAIQALAQLELSREKRDAIKRERDQAEKARVDHQGKSVAAREQAKEFALQVAGKEKECGIIAGKITPLKDALETSLDSFTIAARQVEEAEDHRDTINKWIDGLDALIKSQNRGAATVARLFREISGWDGAKLLTAETTAASAAEVLKDAEAKLTKAEQQHVTLKAQLKEIAGGVCPFLKEKCQQFDPSKVQADLDQQTSAIPGLMQAVKQGKLAYEAAERMLKELRTAHGKISGMETELTEALGGYLDGLKNLNSAQAVSSHAWLLAWEPQLSSMPVANINTLEKIAPVKVVDLQQQLASFVNDAKTWWEKTNAIIKGRFKAFNEEARTRKVQETSLVQYAEEHSRLKVEIQKLTQKATAKESGARQTDGVVTGLTAKVVELDDELKPFINLDNDLKCEQLKRDANRPGHERYLGARSIAGELAARQARLTQLMADESAAQQALLAAAAAVHKAEQDFDPEQLKVAIADHQTKRDRFTTLQTSLEAEQKNLEKEEKRFKEWGSACLERERVSAEIGRCEAAKAITELARKTLRDTAPAVAQHLCNRIAARAQSIFNQMNSEPIELAWDAERYGLRVTPGDRRFAMLSGGEQTKLALAMTLGMIDEFSGLQLCIFDEPTYGVDADSRHKLADAILQAQAAAGLDQLLLVSHDDAFDGKIDYTILLEKSGRLGTRIVLD